MAFTLAVAAGAAAETVGDAERGVDVFRKCSACHQVGKSAINRVGPHLNGVFGRTAGTVERFKYSKHMQRASADGLVWTYETLDAFLENPKSMVSATRMNFQGLKKAQDRADVLAYLRRFSDNPRDIPESEPTLRLDDPNLDPAVLTLEGDPDYGEYLSSECTTCHQADGSNQGIPPITNWPHENFVVAMHAYKQQLRPHPVMRMVAGRLSDEEIAALAAYFGGLE
ncbi:c-type cytochrome [Pelagibius litoralis]|uniref:C-type cytochrome n=2 Tax=Pelagibius litoralis TaxID=374515 RepID=A0A967EYL7_9PROT|nr:c-type cytochrome [Pelagibius litoralis]